MSCTGIDAAKFPNLLLYIADTRVHLRLSYTRSHNTRTDEPLKREALRPASTISPLVVVKLIRLKQNRISSVLGTPIIRKNPRPLPPN